MRNNIVSFPDVTRPPLPPKLLARYEIMEMLSDTKQSETFLLKSKENSKPVVAKQYKKPFAYENSEFNILAQLDHPAIPRPVEDISTANTLCVVREYVEGLPLDELDIPLTQGRALDIAAQICDILSYLHGRTPPVIHRDIKPQNLILDYDDKVHLIDFGISRTFSDSSAKDTFFIGTDGFAPPEQYGFKQTDRRADIYSLGITLCYLLTGRGDIRALDGLANKRLARAIRKCAAFAPEDRYPTADTAKKALLDASKKNTRRILAAAVVLVPLAAAAAFLWPVTQPVTGSTAPPAAIESPYTSAPQAKDDLSDAPAPDTHTPSASPSASPQPAPKVSPSDTPEAAPSVFELSPGGIETVEFREPLIELAVRASLGLDSDVVLVKADLMYVKGIYVYGDKVFSSNAEFDAYCNAIKFYDTSSESVIPLISSLEDLAMMPNLQELQLFYQDKRIDDLTPLANLSRLGSLSIDPSSITDLTPLEGIKTLNYVCLSTAPFTDLTPLMRLPRLNAMTLYNSEFDLEQLREFRHLDNLAIGSKRGNVWEYLPDCPFIILHIPEYGADSLEYFAPYKSSLEELIICWSTITSLAGIEEFTRLKTLDISYTGVTDLSPLLSLPNLKTVKVSTNLYGAVRELGDCFFFVFVFVFFFF